MNKSSMLPSSALLIQRDVYSLPKLLNWWKKNLLPPTNKVRDTVHQSFIRRATLRVAQSVHIAKLRYSTAYICQTLCNMPAHGVR